MALLIDGYNLLHVTGIFDRGSGPGGFQRTREALLRFLSASLEEKQHKSTTIVFDATQAPPGLPSTVMFDEITVRYAKGYPDADTLIEEIIEDSNAPRSLLVVSSDHRIQRAARRRGADYIDSDLWNVQLRKKRQHSQINKQRQLPEKPQGTLSESEIDYWVQEFDEGQLTDLSVPQANKNPAKDRSSKPPSQDNNLENPFPPGYADDLLDE